MTINQLQKRERELRTAISYDAGSSLQDLIEQLINISIEIEHKSNQ